MPEKSNSNPNLPTISLFAGAAIGDKGLEAAGFRLELHNELESDRSGLISANFPQSRVISGNILDRETEIIAIGQKLQRREEVFALVATPPCQGMSPNGLGTLLKNYRLGRRPKLDQRNRLILPALRIAAALQPKWVILENVPRMSNTAIEDEAGTLVRILDLIPQYLGIDYVGEAKVVEFADYGIPQCRQRLITIYSRLPEARELLEAGGSFIPEPTHQKLGNNGLANWVTVRQAIGNFPPLDAKTAKTARDNRIPLHRVPVLDSKKYEWIRHTPENQSAFNNQCVNPECGFDGNPNHGTSRDSAGINRARQDTPLYCLKCGSLLPRPFAINKDGTIRIMKGYTSAYKRMSWDMPAPTLTRNLSFACSDRKIHPVQNRVLSLAEACQLQSISDFDYKWELISAREGKIQKASDRLIREAIGESIPPRFMQILGQHLLSISNREVIADSNKPVQLQLFSEEYLHSLSKASL
ncbi:MAG: DNA cytosine methyltransferase [Oscillatoria sp. SIO1A7]|nr:DNA cytosine methyltransferase [Oscillatoria sp. SIO1A7]